MHSKRIFHYVRRSNIFQSDCSNFKLRIRTVYSCPNIRIHKSVKTPEINTAFSREKNDFSLSGIEEIVKKALDNPKFTIKYPTASFCTNYIKAVVNGNRFNINTITTLFRFVDKYNIKLSEGFFVFSLGFCVKYTDIECGKIFHERIIENKYSGIKIFTRLLDMYMKCGHEEKAYQLFKDMKEKHNIKPDIYHLTCIVGYLIKKLNIEKVFDIIIPFLGTSQTKEEALWTVILHSCSEIKDPEKSRRVYQFMVDMNFKFTLITITAALDMFTKCGLGEEAYEIYNQLQKKYNIKPDLAHLNCIIGYLIGKLCIEEVFEIIIPFIDTSIFEEEIMWTVLLHACSELNDPEKSKRVFQFMVSYNIKFTSQTITAALDMFTKCGLGEEAYEIYKQMQEKYNIKPELAHLNCIIGYLIGKLCIDEVFEITIPFFDTSIFEENIMWTVLLHACSELNDPEKSKRVFQFLVDNCVHFNEFIVSAAVDMFAKNGEIEEAIKVFTNYENQIFHSDCINSMINAYGNHSFGKEAVNLFYKYCKIIKYDTTTFVCILNACSHSGLIEEAKRIYDDMESIYFLKPNAQHKTCIVDCLSRIEGKLEEAETMIKNDSDLMKDMVAWAALLGGCRKFGDVCRGERVLYNMMPLGLTSKQMVGYQVLMGNIYAAAGRPDDERNLRNEISSPKTPGMSWMMINGKKVTFTVGLPIDQATIEKAEKKGYKTDISWSLKGNTKEEKIQSLCGHSEKLAFEYALKNTPEYSTVTIFKNLRVCGDCHAFTEALSKATGRILKLRDSNLFHTFYPENGCSCGGHF